MIQWEGLKLFHKITFEMYPLVLTEYLYHSMVRSDVARSVRKPSIKYKFKTAKTKNAFFHRICYLYNLLPDTIRISNIKVFGKDTKIYIRNNYDLKTILKIPE